jgi:2-polyprenyl-3-methyl-5-hydroxy-6-metoxy-1,4-benzoquinol methylase
MRQLSEKELIYERLGEAFGAALSEYDTARRVEVLIEDFLGDMDLKGTSVLDVGCGWGFFSRALRARGADVLACDIGDELLERVRRTVGCECVRADALALVDQFGVERFDVVLSSECIEHTPSPERALQQMARVLKPGGRLAVSTPNMVWYPVVKLSTTVKVRPFDGLENFSTFGSIRRSLQAEGLRVVKERGLHLIPFQLRCFRMSRWCDEYLQAVRFLMINLCVLAEKPARRLR